MEMTGNAGGDAQVSAVRRFNRFYTRQIGLLEEHLLRSEFSLTESRVLYELAQRDGLNAGVLAQMLGLDAGYLSRILKKFEARGLLSRVPSPDDGRQTLLYLTEAGQAAFAPLNETSHREVAAMLSRLTAGGREELVRAMTAIERLLGGEEPRVPYILRPLRIGDIGWIIHRQALFYARDYGWDIGYEALVAEILAGFVRDFDSKKEAAWIAEREGEVVGSVFLVRQSDEVAKLRLLYVEPQARGLGIGRRLVEECIAGARARGYRTLTLWTNDVLTEARRIYQRAGFTLTGEERHHSFGRDLVGQTWDLTL